MNRIIKRKPKRRRGFTLIELLVTGTLIASGLAVVGKLSVLHGRMWQQTRHERVAIEELSNHLERLTALSPTERTAAIESLEPSPLAAATLAEVSLVVDTIDDSDGNRLVMRIDWNRGHPAEPLTLVAWVDPVQPDEVP